MRSTHEGRRNTGSPLDRIKQDPTLKYIAVSKEPIKDGYKGYATQADYFEIERGYKPEAVDPRLLKNPNDLVMTIPRSEAEEWDRIGRIETQEALDSSTTTDAADIGGGNSEIEVTRDDMQVRSIARRKRRVTKRKITKIASL